MTFRFGFELLGSVSLLACQYLLLLAYASSAGLRGVNEKGFWCAVSLGYVALVLGSSVCRQVHPDSYIRRHLDTWLAAGLLAAALTFGLVWLEWPLNVSTGGGHGHASRGSLNTALYPWLHLAVGLTLVWLDGRRPVPA